MNNKGYVMNEIFEAIKKSSIEIDAILKTENLGKSDTKNSSGDNQLKLDILSDDIIQANFKSLKIIKQIVSEEQDSIVDINKDGEYLIGYDPLDGSSLIDVNLSVGSIYGIYKNNFSGKNLIASCYVVFGPRVELVICIDKPKLYKLQNKEFVYVKDLALDDRGRINATGGTQKYWSDNHKKSIEKIFNLGHRLRYSGGMVPDLHQVLLKKGGLFSYPSTSDAKDGKLRMIFEVFPFAYIFKKAGGFAINHNKQDLLSMTPENIHDTTPCYFGSKIEIDIIKENL
jgi:fructose-1,6-bisphosphatase I